MKTVKEGRDVMFKEYSANAVTAILNSEEVKALCLSRPLIKPPNTIPLGDEDYLHGREIALLGEIDGQPFITCYFDDGGSCVWFKPVPTYRWILADSVDNHHIGGIPNALFSRSLDRAYEQLITEQIILKNGGI